jgi:hypothetical protein
MMDERLGDDRLGFTRPKMDGKFFLLRDGGWARLMDHEVHERYTAKVHLAAVTDQVRWQVIRGVDPWGEILLTGSIHLP